jgi:hypothetical protein
MISLVFLPVLAFVEAMVCYHGNVGQVVAFMCHLGFVPKVFLAICAVAITISGGCWEYFRRVRILARDQAALKLQADADAPLLAAAEQGGGTGAG